MTPPGPNGSYPLTAAQREMWFAQQLLGDVPVTTTQYLDITGPLDRATMQEAGRRTAHELGAYLRFAESGGEVRQWVDYDQFDELDFLDLRDRPNPFEAALDWMHDDMVRPLDPTIDPPMNSTLIAIGPNRHLAYTRVHHILLDGYGAMLFQRRHAEIYAALVEGVELPAIEYQSPAILIDADAAYRASTRFETDRRHWEKQVTELPEPPTLALRPGVPSARSIVVGADVPQTPTDILIAAFAAFLSRMTGTDTVPLSLPVTARTNAVLRRTAGMVSNVVPLLIAIDTTATVDDVTAVTRAQLSGALRHQRFRGEDMVRGRRGPVGFGPAINIMNFESGIDLVGARGTLHLLSTGPVDDLSLNIYPSSEHGVRLEFEANPNRYTHAELAAHHRRFMRFLGDFVAAQSDTPATDLPVLDAAERARLLPMRGDETAPPTTLPDLIADAVSRNARGTALVHGDRRWSYTELDVWTNRLARALIAAGAGPETLVATAIERSAESVATVWAVTKSGAAFVPLDPDYPAERIQTVLDDCGARLGVTTSAQRPTLPDHIHWLIVDDPATVRDLSSAPVTDADRSSPLTHRHPAYLIYTSGSTGVPKGVLVTHGGWANLAAERRDRYGFSPASTTLHHASPGFDMAVGEQLSAIAGASTMIVASRYVTAGPDLAELMRREGVTNAVITPAVLATLDPADLAQLRVLGVGGEAIRGDLVNAWAPGRTMRNGYGPTEATDIATIGSLVAGQPVTIGAPLRGTHAVVLDARLRPVPPGRPGELYLGGPALARGYHGRHGATAARFVADPYGPVGGRLYRTGDLVTITDDDTLIYHGRTDFQVKIRGHRIEPGEVESTLTARADIARAAVTAHVDTRGETHLVAYVVPAAGRVVDVDRLKTDIAAILPTYLRPAAYTVLDTLPLTSNGKLDARALPAPVFERTEFREPTTPAERRVAAVFADVLEVETIGADADFFAEGGTSLTATRVAAQLGTSVRTVFDAPTVAALAVRTGDEQGPHRNAPAPRDRPDEIPLAPAQLLMWMFNQLHPTSTAYHLAAALDVQGPLDISAARSAVTAVVDRHEVLRTTYPEVDHAPRQAILSTPDAVEQLDLHATDVTPEHLADRIRELASAPFDMTTDLPIRVRLLTLGTDRHVLLVVAHHIATDGWSFGPLIADLTAAYAAFSSGDRPHWEPLPLQYADYALWHHKLLGDPDDPTSIAAEQTAHWTETLAGVSGEVTLSSRPSSADDGGGANLDFVIDAQTHIGLAELARSHGATAFMVAYAAFVVLLHELSGSDDITVGTPIAGRGHPVLDHMIGMFVNTLPVRTRIDPADSVTTLIGRARTAAIETFDNSDVPMYRIAESVNAPRFAGRHPIFQTVFSYENLPPLPELTMAGLEITRLDVPQDHTHFELALTLHDHAATGDITAEFRYATGLFDRETVVDFADRYRRILANMIADPSASVGGLTTTRVEPRRPAIEHSPAIEHNGQHLPRADEREQTSTEQTIAAAFADVTGASSVRLDDSFFELGGTSLTVFALRSTLSRLLDRDIDLRAFVEYPTVRGLAGHISGTTDPDDTQRWLDRLISDSTLDASFSIADDAEAPHDAGDVLLTGATGFLGTHLLRELLDRNDSRVRCLIRGDDTDAALERLVAGMRYYRLRHDDIHDRVVVQIGDLNRPRLGLDPDEFAELAQGVAVIYHNGAYVDHLAPYEDLRAANVGGTLDVLRLAATTRVKPVHFVSTLNAVMGANHSGIVLENTSIEPAAVVRHGYVATKWVAEQLVVQAGERGLPVAVYRPGLISGSTGTGVIAADDAMWTMIRAAALLGVAPDVGDAVVSLTPVDYVASAIVAIGTSGLPTGGRYQLVNTEPMRVDRILDRLVRMGYPIHVVEPDEARQRLADRVATNTDLMRAALLLGNLGDSPDTALSDVVLDDANTASALAGSDVRRPRVDDDLIDRYLHRFREAELLPAASKV